MRTFVRAFRLLFQACLSALLVPSLLASSSNASGFTCGNQYTQEAKAYKPPGYALDCFVRRKLGGSYKSSYDYLYQAEVGPWLNANENKIKAGGFFEEKTFKDKLIRCIAIVSLGSGAVSNVKVTKSSMSKHVDEIAIDMITLATPLSDSPALLSGIQCKNVSRELLIQFNYPILQVSVIPNEEDKVLQKAREYYQPGTRRGCGWIDPRIKMYPKGRYFSGGSWIAQKRNAWKIAVPSDLEIKPD
jgi:hypothetical protein